MRLLCSLQRRRLCCGATWLLLRPHLLPPLILGKRVTAVARSAPASEERLLGS
jgi:hypothetical protein